MTRKERAVEILKNELACVRNVDCERSECRNCNLVMPEHDITEALQMAIKALEHEPIDKSAMMYDIYMEGVNMSGEYQGCWVRFKDIEKIVDKYTRSEET